MRNADLDIGYWTHPKTQRLEDLIAGRHGEAWGLAAAAIPPRLWCWAVTNAPDGRLVGLPTRRIARLLAWPEKWADELVSALVECGFLDQIEGGFVIHSWEKRTGNAAGNYGTAAQSARALRGWTKRREAAERLERAKIAALDAERRASSDATADAMADTMAMPRNMPSALPGPARPGPALDPEPEEEPPAAPAIVPPPEPRQERQPPPKPKRPRRNGTAAEKPAEPPSRVQQFIAAFCDEYRAATGGPYSLTGKDRGQAKAFADGIAPEHWERRHEIARAYLAAEREWWADKGRPLCGLVASWARYAEQVMRAAAAEQQRALNPDGAPF